MFALIGMKNVIRSISTKTECLSTTQPFSLFDEVSKRYVHSSTQIKRLFKKNATRRRIEQKMQIDRTPEPLDPPKYEAVYKNVEFLKNGWSAPPNPNEVPIPSYPFKVKRTTNKPCEAVGFLPVYSQFRKDGTKATTRIRRVSGDTDEFIRELRSVLNIPPSSDPSTERIRVRTGGTIEIFGNRVREVKSWLAGLGF